MQERQFNSATFELADNGGMSGMAIAVEIKRGLRTQKERSFWRTASSIVLGYLMAVGLLLFLTPLPARADNDMHPGHEDKDKSIRAEITALQAQVASLQATVSTLQDQVNSLQTSNTALKTQLAKVQSNHALLLGPFVSIDPNPEIGVIGPNIIFSGANIHIVSGSGATDDNGNPRGLGNLIIGYDEDPINPLAGDSSDGLPIMQTPGVPSPLSPGDRGGSHNLVIGGGNRFTRSAFGGLVMGERNTIESFGASVSGGFNNTAGGLFASVSAGVRNSATGQFASVSGGGLNIAGATAGASVSGGFSNTASGPYASVSGGYLNIASETFGQR
jgi:hypothetical protein